MRLLTRPDHLAIVLIAIIVVFFGISVYLSNHASESDDDHIKHDPEAHYAIQIEKEKTFPEALISDPVAYYTRTLAWATITLAVFTVILACVTILIWLDGKETSRRQHIVARRALIHSAKSVRAAETAIETASLSSQRQLRAYVGIKTGQVDLTLENGNMQGVVAIRLRNSGLTPAYDVRSKIGLQNGTGFNSQIIAESVAGKTFVFPQGEHVIKSAKYEIILKGDTHSENTEEIFVFGAIEYRDAFREMHTTTFRFIFAGIDIAKGSASLASCDEGNEAT